MWLVEYAPHRGEAGAAAANGVAPGAGRVGQGRPEPTVGVMGDLFAAVE